MRTVLRVAASASVAALIAIAPAQAIAQTRVFSGATAASWIAPPNVPGDSSLVFHARRTFDLASKPEHFVVHVSADNKYRLYVNGEQVASGPQRADVLHWRYETVDLAPQLRAGRNVIAALVWNWGAAHPVAQHSYRSGFLLQGDAEREAALVNTGAGWKLRVDSAYRFVPLGFGDVRGYYAAAPGEAMDGARYPWGWERSEYDDAAWFTVPAPAAGRGGTPPRGGPGGAVVGRLLLPTTAPGGGEVAGWLLTPRDIPAMEETPTRFASVRRAQGVPANDGFMRGTSDLVVPPHTKASVLLDQAHTTNAYPCSRRAAARGAP